MKFTLEKLESEKIGIICNGEEERQEIMRWGYDKGLTQHSTPFEALLGKEHTAYIVSDGMLDWVNRKDLSTTVSFQELLADEASDLETSYEPKPRKSKKTESETTEKISLERAALNEISRSMENIVVGAVKQVLNEHRKPLIVQLPNREQKEITESTHIQFPEILSTIGAGLNVFLVGEAGSGKTHLIEQCAESLSLPFYCISVCSQTSASVLLGYMNANGDYVRTLFREAYENGGVFLLDEIDNGNPNVLSVLNSAMANSVCAFPDKMVKKHKDFIVCASGNTYGTGADRRYVGRLEIDGATLDRFVFIELKYDEVLERNVCGDEKVSNLIQYMRRRAQEFKMRHIISPRASIFVARLTKTGVPIETALKNCVFKGMSQEEINKIKGDSSKFRELVSAIKIGE